MTGLRDLRPALRLVAVAVALTVAAVAGATFAAHRAFDEAALDAALRPALARALGDDVVAERTALHVWPVPRIVMEGVAARHASAARIEARLSGTSLLGGRLRVRRLAWSGGAIDLDALGVTDIRSSAGAMERLGIGRFELENVATTLRGERILVREARVEGGAVRLAASGNGTWNGRAASASFAVDDVTAFATRSPLRIALDAPDLSFTFAGDGNARGLGRGDLSVSGPSLARALAWLGRPSLGAGDHAYSATGRVDDTAWGWEFAGAEISIGAVTGEGSLGLVRGARPRLTGTLALGPVATDLAALGRIAAGIAPGADADLRFSAPRLTLGDEMLAGVAATLRADANTLGIEVNDARYATGRATGRLALPRTADASPGQLDLRLADIEATDLPFAWPVGAPRLDGRLDVTAAIGPLVDGSAAVERATLTVTARDGKVSGLDLRAIARFGERLEDDAARRGDTAFETFTLNATLAPGMVEIEELRVAGPGLAARMNGRIDLIRGVPTIRGEVASVDVMANAADAGLSLGPKATAFFVTGTLADPLVVPVAPSQ